MYQWIICWAERTGCGKNVEINKNERTATQCAHFQLWDLLHFFAGDGVGDGAAVDLGGGGHGAVAGESLGGGLCLGGLGGLGVDPGAVGLGLALGQEGLGLSGKQI